MIRVVKVGGSLFQFPGLVAHVIAWLNEQPSAKNVLIIGGGPWVDAIRATQASLNIRDTEAHWLAIEAMSLTANIFVRSSQAVGTALPLVDRFSDISRFDVAVLDILDELRLQPDALPASWSVTSDSIAAWVAKRLAADELVLLKARAVQDASSAMVDDFFPIAVEGLDRVRMVDFCEYMTNCNISGNRSRTATLAAANLAK